jgi:hypothetical protein
VLVGLAAQDLEEVGIIDSSLLEIKPEPKMLCTANS